MKKLHLLNLIGSALLISGCAASIPPEQLKNYAAVFPDTNQNGPSAITAVDGHSVFTFSGRSVDVTPGEHWFQITNCPSGSTSGCWSNQYTLQVKEGLKYVIRGTNVDVFDRFNPDTQIDTLVKTNSGYMSKSEVQQRQMAAAERDRVERAAVQAAVQRNREANLPKVRKIGTRICQQKPGNVVLVGYVEGLSPEKVQIRISDAYIKNVPSAHPANFQPTIIWDSPMNWDLCE